MIVFHGSFCKVEKPLVERGRDRLDFGKGFYLTDIRSQAVGWAKRISLRKGCNAILNIYELDLDKIKSSYNCRFFPAYDKEWLEFIVACRSGKNVWEHYDVIQGGVANDRVVDTVEAYMAGLMPLEYALGELAKHQPNNQICITNQNVIDECLVFKGADQC